MARPRSAKTAPLYSIQLVSRATGLTADTLRMWERRYGYPAPERDDRGNRVYSDADIERLLQVKRALQAGARPHDVVGRPLEELGRMLERVAVAQTQAPEERGALTPLLDALARSDASALRVELRKAAYALGPRRFVTEVAAPFTTAIGTEWAASRLDVNAEHLASSMLSAQLEVLLASFEDPGAPIVLMATLPGERHTLGLLMAAVFVATEGVSVRYLGADLPAEQMLRAADRTQAAVVAVSLSAAADLQAARRDLRWILDTMPRHRELWVGGAASRNLDLRHPRFRALPDWDDLSLALSRLRRKK